MGASRHGLRRAVSAGSPDQCFAAFLAFLPLCLTLPAPFLALPFIDFAPRLASLATPITDSSCPRATALNATIRWLPSSMPDAAQTLRVLPPPKQSQRAPQMPRHSAGLLPGCAALARHPHGIWRLRKDGTRLGGGPSRGAGLDRSRLARDRNTGRAGDVCRAEAERQAAAEAGQPPSPGQRPKDTTRRLAPPIPTRPCRAAHHCDLLDPLTTGPNHVTTLRVQSQ